ncbi:uncharacterized protein BJX67DRAFT_91842 [Aspergillus lucknowensis]|uniref:Rhodopsin domain-containing protein n=1 Tax=Aspergillus lucknowensis TaxID=176173 RepID=A0ABR4M5Q3_9EURO
MMSPQAEGANYGVPHVNACWALTALASVALIFRYTVKAWAGWILPRVSSPTRVWGAEDLLFVIGYAFDIAHIVLIQKSLDYGLGRHLWFLTDAQRIGAMKYDFLSQPLAVTASMFSRCGMTWFLYTCFNSADKHIRIAIIVGMVIQIIANSVTVLQIVLQCGPNPYRVTNRAAYFHYMWDGIPTDGSVACNSPNVQTTIGFVQGGFNTAVDFALTVLSAMQLWQFSIRAIDGTPSNGNSFLARFKRMPKQARNRRIWQTLILSGPLALSGCASIVKTYLLKSLGERNDFTHNIIPFILWVKIENYSILLATCGPVIRLFVRVVFDKKSSSKWGYWTSGPANQYGRGLDLDGQSHTQNQGSVVMSVFADKGDTGSSRARGGTRTSDGGVSYGGGGGDSGSSPGGVRGVTVKTDITVQVDEDGASTAGLVRSGYS